jgi:hypothetical protein
MEDDFVALDVAMIARNWSETVILSHLQEVITEKCGELQ